jgi:hypothetical protein
MSSGDTPMLGKAGVLKEVYPSFLFGEELAMLETLLPPGKAGRRPRAMGICAVRAWNSIGAIKSGAPGACFRVAILPPPCMATSHGFAMREYAESLLATLRERCRLQPWMRSDSQRWDLRASNLYGA